MLTAGSTEAAEDVIAGYAMFYRGHDPKCRAAPNVERWISMVSALVALVYARPGTLFCLRLGTLPFG